MERNEQAEHMQCASMYKFTRVCLVIWSDQLNILKEKDCVILQEYFTFHVIFITCQFFFSLNLPLKLTKTKSQQTFAPPKLEINLEKSKLFKTSQQN